jgi:hypothetical protein
LPRLNELDDIADELGPNVWLSNSRRKKKRILLIIETEAAFQLLTGTAVCCYNRQTFFSVCQEN